MDSGALQTKVWGSTMPGRNRSQHYGTMDEDDESGLGKLQGNPDLVKLSSEEKKSITHFAFCGKIEFKILNFDQL
jgi:hypothetical protein